ncbi:MAG TPA: DUF6160 family protein [Aquabacterium sp.]|nr:DUF6160 family protein [Aquabacterium sp.]
MKTTFKQEVIALVCLSACWVAQAAGPLSDQDLRKVQGKDGVTLMGDLNIKTDSFVYTDTDANGGSISLNGITIRGMFVRQYDILRGQPLNYVSDANAPGSFGYVVARSMQPYLGESGTVTASSQTAQQMNLALSAGLYNGADVIQIAFPNAGLSAEVMPSFTVQSITTGNSDKSLGSLTVDKIDFQGTKRWLWPH